VEKKSDFLKTPFDGEGVGLMNLLSLILWQLLITMVREGFKSFQPAD
jgi:hypothetical protein